MKNQRAVDLRITPYLQESSLQIVLDIIVAAIVLTVFIIASFPLIATVAIVMGYFVIVLFLHYRVTIQALIDKRKNDYITEKVSIKKFKFNEEYTFTGNRFGHSNIRLFYPKEIRVCRYKISVTDSNGTEKKLRSVMSFKRSLQFSVLDKNQTEQLQVTYLKRSRILIWVDLVDNINSLASRKKKEQVKKAIHTINTSV